MDQKKLCKLTQPKFISNSVWMFGKLWDVELWWYHSPRIQRPRFRTEYMCIFFTQASQWYDGPEQALTIAHQHGVSAD